jgi:uncharacterized protein YndB with AHSA1/START domain
MIPSVIKTIDVTCSADAAFTIFTRDISSWWPKDKHSVSAMGGQVAREVTLDARLGGQVIEIDHKGDQILWGTISAFDEGQRISINWHIGKPADQATSVDVRFESTASGARVVLEHSGWEALGDEGQANHDGYANGWVHVFETCFAGACV